MSEVKVGDCLYCKGIRSRDGGEPSIEEYFVRKVGTKYLQVARAMDSTYMFPIDRKTLRQTINIGRGPTQYYTSREVLIKEHHTDQMWKEIRSKVSNKYSVGIQQYEKLVELHRLVCEFIEGDVT